jgi:membrane protein
MPQMKQGLYPAAQEIWVVLKETYNEWSQDNAPILGAALAFYTIFSLAPIFIIIMAIVGFFLGKESVQIYLVKELGQLVGRENAANVMNIILHSYKPGSGVRATLIAILLMLVGSTTIFIMLKNALNAMWGVEYQEKGYRAMIIERFQSFAIVMFVGFIIFLSMVTGSLLASFNNFVESVYAMPILFFQVIDYVLSMVLLTLIFASLYKFLPDVTISWRDVWVGAAITALLFSLGKLLLSLYIARSGVTSVYGAAGSLVAVLLWVYYSAQIIFVGAEFTQVYARRYGAAIEPQPLAHKERA